MDISGFLLENERITHGECSVIDKYQHMHFFTFNTVLV